MPQLIGAIVPIFTAIGHGLAAAAPALGAVSSGVGLGTTIAGLASKPDLSQLSQQPTDLTSSQPPPASPEQNASNEMLSRMRQALQVRQQIPGLQANVGGSVAPDYLNSLGSEFAGVYGSNPNTINPGSFDWLSTAQSV